MTITIAFGRRCFTPLYPSATSLSDVVDMKPQSTNPLAPFSSALKKWSGKSIRPPKPRYSSVPSGMRVHLATFVTAETRTKMVVANVLPPSLNNLNFSSG